MTHPFFLWFWQPIATFLGHMVLVLGIVLAVLVVALLACAYVKVRNWCRLVATARRRAHLTLSN